jgi:hypothetical protein
MIIVILTIKDRGTSPSHITKSFFGIGRTGIVVVKSISLLEQVNETAAIMFMFLENQRIF